MRQSVQLKQFCHARRTCYDHLAGELGMKVAEVLLERELSYFWLVGSTIATCFFEKGWITKAEKNLSVHHTYKGTKVLQDQFGIEINVEENKLA